MLKADPQMHSFTSLGTIEMTWNSPNTNITAEVHFQVGLNLQTMKSVTANAVVRKVAYETRQAWLYKDSLECCEGT